MTDPDPDFDAWRDSLPETHWARYDLSACHMGWDAAMKSRRQSPAGVEPVAWVTEDILAAMKRGERVVPGWKKSDDFCIPLYASPPKAVTIADEIEPAPGCTNEWLSSKIREWSADYDTAILDATDAAALFAELLAYRRAALSSEARPAPDDGLAAKLSLFADHLFPAVLEYGREIALLREAATALQSKDEQIERLTQERDEALDRHSSAVMGEIEATQRTEAAEQQVQKLTAENERLREALTNLISYVEHNECQHESVHRGGAIWTICDGCGAKWADDKGGFQPYKEPPELTATRSALETQEGGK